MTNIFIVHESVIDNANIFYWLSYFKRRIQLFLDKHFSNHLFIAKQTEIAPK